MHFSLLTTTLITAGTMLGMESIEQKLTKAGAKEEKIATSQGNIAVWDTVNNISFDDLVKRLEKEDPRKLAQYVMGEMTEKESENFYQSQLPQAIVFIHGNSASGKIFLKQFEDLGKKYRLIAIDLPGHGNSDAAKDPSTYSFLGYAKVVAEVLNKLNLKDPIVVGWSLGGHIALELSLLMPNLKGILITGTPPIALTMEGMMKGFKPVPEIMGLLGYPQQFNEQQAKQFMGLGGINMELPETAFITKDAINTKGEARKNMIDARMQGRLGTDEAKIVGEMTIPLAIIAGENDAGINNDYIMNQVKYNSLWKNKVNVIKNAGHAVFWENADDFNKILDQFVQSLK